MNRILRIAAAAAALALAAPAVAQQSTQTTQGKVGIGVGMPTTEVGSFFNTLNSITGVPEGPQIYVPINVTPNLRIEPQFGYLSNNDDELDETDSSFTLGAGVLYLMPIAQQTNLYVGGRLALTWAKDESHPGFAGGALVKTTQRSTMFAPVLGGEYVPNPRFSVGAEGQLQFVSLGDPKQEVAGGGTATAQGGSIKSTQALLFVRVYFM